MMDRISQATIDQILNAADIVEVVGEVVQLQPAGKNLKGLCPFHSEKTPSFFVSPEKHIFNCFGCGEKGNAATFISKYRNIPFFEALKQLADRYHIPMDYEVSSGPDEKTKRLYEITEAATAFYGLSLTNKASGKPALEYLNRRGLDIHTIQYFDLGFAPNEMDGLFQILKTKYQELDLLELGLIKKNDAGSYYDLFRNRIIFPIRNDSGKVVGYSGRIFGDSKDEAKYVNSPYTTLFTKGDILYNLDRAQPDIKTKKRIFLYEGFMDVIASVRAGIKESVCSMGTALTPQQASLLRRYSEKVVLCYDGDSAGFEAMEKALPILENAGLQVSLLILPEELDPDDYIKKYSEGEYVKYVETHQIDKYEFRYQYLKKHTDFSKTAEIERFKIALFALLLKEQSGMVTEIFLRHLAEDANVEYETIRADFSQYGLSQRVSQSLLEKREKITTGLIMNKYERAELILINYYAKSKEYRKFILEKLSSGFCENLFHDEIISNINDLLDVDPDADIQNLVPLRFSTRRDEVIQILCGKKDEYLMAELEDCLDTINDRNLLNSIREMQNKLKLAQTDDEKMKLRKKILDENIRRKALNGKKRNLKKTD